LTQFNKDDKRKNALKNNGSTATAMNVTSDVTPLDTCASLLGTHVGYKFGNIAPGIAVEAPTSITILLT
jgi:hypothetical protein